MIDLNDKQVRRQMVERYLNAETSIEEERQLADFYAKTTETLSEEEEDVRMLLQTIESATDGDFDLSDSKVAEVDRLMATPSPVRHRRLAIAGWISAVAASVVVLFVLFGNHTDSNMEHSGEQIAMTQPEQITNHVQTEKSEELTTSAITSSLPTANIEVKNDVHQNKSTKRKQPKRSAVKPDDVTPVEPVRANSHSLDDVMAAANIMGEQVETYHIQPVGDATIVTKTFDDGTSSSCIVCAMNDGSGYSVIPL